LNSENWTTQLYPAVPERFKQIREPALPSLNRSSEEDGSIMPVEVNSRLRQEKLVYLQRHPDITDPAAEEARQATRNVSSLVEST